MKQKLLVKLFGSKTDRDYKKNLPVIEDVNRIAETFQGFAEPEFCRQDRGIQETDPGWGDGRRASPGRIRSGEGRL